jgi:putative redox protein
MAEKSTRRMDVTLIDGMHFQATGKNNVSVSIDSSHDDGGVSSGPTPMELMLVALGGCTGMDVISILRKKRQDVTAYRVEVTGTVSDDFPHVYTHIAIRHVVVGNGISDEALRHAIELSETKYCGAHAMLKQATEMTTSYETGPARASD